MLLAVFATLRWSMLVEKKGPGTTEHDNACTSPGNVGELGEVPIASTAAPRTDAAAAMMCRPPVIATIAFLNVSSVRGCEGFELERHGAFAH